MFWYRGAETGSAYSPATRTRWHIFKGTLFLSQLRCFPAPPLLCNLAQTHGGAQTGSSSGRLRRVPRTNAAGGVGGQAALRAHLPFGLPRALAQLASHEVRSASPCEGARPFPLLF
eukprot:3937065-Rhodomonas_salina.4